ncbi:putative inactive receptor kinase, partial [Dissostichus eleginoides]
MQVCNYSKANRCENTLRGNRGTETLPAPEGVSDFDERQDGARRIDEMNEGKVQRG